jgi:hypothetical protein
MEDAEIDPRSRIHEYKITFRFLGIIVRALRPEVAIYSAYNVYVINQFQTTFSQGGGGVKSVSSGDKEESFQYFCPNCVQEFCLRSVAALP